MINAHNQKVNFKITKSTNNIKQMFDKYISLKKLFNIFINLFIFSLKKIFIKNY